MHVQKCNNKDLLQFLCTFYKNARAGVCMWEWERVKVRVMRMVGTLLSKISWFITKTWFWGINEIKFYGYNFTVITKKLVITLLNFVKLVKLCTPMDTFDQFASQELQLKFPILPRAKILWFCAKSFILQKQCFIKISSYNNIIILFSIFKEIKSQLLLGSHQSLLK